MPTDAAQKSSSPARLSFPASTRRTTGTSRNAHHGDDEVVGRDHPGHADDRGVERAVEVGQCEHDDRRVRERDGHRGRDDERQQARAAETGHAASVAAPTRRGSEPASARERPACAGLSDGPSRARTGDLLAASQTLSQLSYGPLVTSAQSSGELETARDADGGPPECPARPDERPGGSGRGGFGRLLRDVAPEVFEPVEVARFLREDVQHDVEVVGDDPRRLALAGGRAREQAVRPASAARGPRRRSPSSAAGCSPVHTTK